jgi:hypothetical protein
MGEIMLKVDDIIQAKKEMLKILDSMQVKYFLTDRPITVFTNGGKFTRIYLWWNDTKNSTHCFYEDLELTKNKDIPDELIQ